MSNLMKEALADIRDMAEGLSEEQAPPVSSPLNNQMSLDKMQARHVDIMKDVLPKMLKVQREMKGRRYRVSTCYVYCDCFVIVVMFIA